MATEEQRARRRAQRELAKALQEGRRNILPSSLKGGARASNLRFGYAVMRGDEPMPDPGTMEARNLARLASQARWGKADPRFEAAFAQYFYHKREQVNPDEEEETREDEDGEEEE